MEDRYLPEQLEQMHQQLWHYVLQFANASAVQERNRIARDLHDSLGHALTALNFQLQTAMKLCQPNPTQAQEFLNEAHRLVTIASQEMRHSVRALRDETPELQPFEALLHGLIQDFHQTTGVHPSVEVNLPVELPTPLKMPLYRVIQESLNNARKYARATAVQIQIETTETTLRLIVQDNGQGFDPNQAAGGYGLQGMQERIAVLHGTLSVDSAIASGCSIRAEIPLQFPVSLSAIAAPSVPASPNPAIEIGAWQPLNLNAWQAP